MALRYNPQTGQYEDDGGMQAFGAPSRPAPPPDPTPPPTDPAPPAPDPTAPPEAPPPAAAETPQQEYDRFLRDYWAPDRDAVLAQKKAALSGGGGGGKGAQDFYAALQAYGGSGTFVDRLKAFVAEHPEYGATITGSKGDKVTIGGRTYDMIQAAGAGGGSGWTFNDVTDGGGMAPTGNAIDASYLAPWEKEFNNPEFQYSDFGGWGDFKAPTADSILQDPSYQFRRDQMTGALENSAAARGVLNSGGTLRDILDQTGKYASLEYGNIWNRDFSAWNQQGQNKYNTWTANRGNAADNWSKNYQSAWAKYLDQKDSFFQNQENPFSKLYRLGALGVGAAQ